MSDSTLSQAMRAVDEELNSEARLEHLGATSMNATLEGMYILHGRTRMVGPDFKAYRVIHRALMGLPAASAEEHGTDVGPTQKVDPSPVLDAMQRAANDVEAARQAAQ